MQYIIYKIYFKIESTKKPIRTDKFSKVEIFQMTQNQHTEICNISICQQWIFWGKKKKRQENDPSYDNYKEYKTPGTKIKQRSEISPQWKL